MKININEAKIVKKWKVREFHQNLISQLFTRNAVIGNFRDQPDENSGADNYKRQKLQIFILYENNACTGHDVDLSKDANSEPFFYI